MIIVLVNANTYKLAFHLCPKINFIKLLKPEIIVDSRMCGTLVFTNYFPEYKL